MKWATRCIVSQFHLPDLVHADSCLAMIGRTEYHHVSGTRCATDFVELPSILMEHFLTSPQVLRLFHNDVKQSSPPSETILPAEANRSATLDALRQIVLALLDQEYHSPVVLQETFDSTVALANLQNTFDVFPYVPGTSWQTHFGHLFTYGATYYSYLFDRAIASQVWKQIFSEDPLDRERGERYKNEVLRWGGSKDPWQILAKLLSAPQLAEGGSAAMKEVGKWGVAEAGVAGQDIH
jgi:mitochondrial intermediate peptidase